jgi:hypothetical protein
MRLHCVIYDYLDNLNYNSAWNIGHNVLCSVNIKVKTKTLFLLKHQETTPGLFIIRKFQVPSYTIMRGRIVSR